MSRKRLVLFASVVALLSTHFALAQSAALRLPLMVVKDADGKVVAQVANAVSNELYVLLGIDGVPGLFGVNLEEVTQARKAVPPPS